MQELLSLVGAIPIIIGEVDWGIYFFLDYLAKTELGAQRVFVRGRYEETREISKFIENSRYLPFQNLFNINPERQAVFQDSLGHIFTGDKDLPRRNKTLILEISDFNYSPNRLPQINVRRAAPNALGRIRYFRDKKDKN